MLFHFLTRAQLPLLHVGARGKRPAGAGEDGDIGLGVEVEAVHRGQGLPRHVVVEGVQAGRPVEGDCRDTVADVVEDEGFWRAGHGRLLDFR